MLQVIFKKMYVRVSLGECLIKTFIVPGDRSVKISDVCICRLVHRFCFDKSVCACTIYILVLLKP